MMATSSIFICLFFLFISTTYAVLPYSPYTTVEQRMFSFQIVQPMNLTNRNFWYFPSAFSSNIPLNFQADIVINDVSPSGCLPFPTTNQNGQTFTGKIVLLMSGGSCSDALKYQNVQDSGAIMYLSYACRLEDYCDLLVPVSYDPVPNATIPLIAINNADGVAIVQQLLNNLTVTLKLDGTGPILNTELTNLVNFATALQSVAGLPIYTPTQSGSLRPWTDLLSPSTVGDPCLDRIMGLWCINGTIVELDLTDWNILNFPPELGLFTSLISLRAYYKAAPVLPCEFGQLTHLYKAMIFYNSFDLNQTESCWSGLTNLHYLDISANPITALPSILETLPFEVFYAAYSPSLATALDFTKMTNLILVSMSGNSLTTLPNLSGLQNLLQANFDMNMIDDDITHSFDNLPSLITVVLTTNQLTGFLPAFINTTALQYLEFSQNQFMGGIPTTWNLPNLTTFSANNNFLDGPITVLGTFNQLTYIDLGYNLLNASYAGSVGAFLVQIPRNAVEVNLEHNLIEGPIGPDVSTHWVALTKLKLSHNMITSIDDTFLTQFIVLKYLDVSYNQLSGPLPGTYPALTLLWIDLSNNNLGPDPAIPYYLLQSTTSYNGNLQERYLCPTLMADPAIYGDYIFILDASSYSYINCVCEQGYYGIPPNCTFIPIQSSLTDKNNTVISFTDGAFGNNRFQQGIDTIWQVSRAIDPTKVQVVQFTVEVNTSVFSNFSDIISIYEGGSDLRGNRVFILRGTDSYKNFSFRPSDSAYLDTSPNATNITIFKVDVFAATGTLNFQSRNVGLQHFQATVTFYENCPAGFTNTLSTQCRFLETYILPQGLKIAVAVVTALSVCLILVTMVYIFVSRRQIIIKSASPLFCLLTLVGLLLMSFACLTYIASPQDGQWVCEIRVWLTAISIVLILGNLLVKANRIHNIFNDMSFQVRAYSDQNLLKTVGFMLLIEFILLACFTGFQLSGKEIAAGVGSDAYTIIEVHQCSTATTPYWVWFAIQFAYLGLFIIFGAYVAFKTKDTPTAFNESNHILGALLEFLFLPLIFVPLNFYQEGNPASLVILRGLGQNFIVITLTAILFGPKLYYIGAGRGNDDNLSDLSRYSGATPSKSRTSRKYDVEMIPSASTSDTSPNNNHDSPKFRDSSLHRTPRETREQSFRYTDNQKGSHASHGDEANSLAERNPDEV